MRVVREQSQHRIVERDGAPVLAGPEGLAGLLLGVFEGQANGVDAVQAAELESFENLVRGDVKCLR